MENNCDFRYYIILYSKDSKNDLKFFYTLRESLIKTFKLKVQKFLAISTH